MGGTRERPLVPEALVLRIGAILALLPRTHEETAWVGTRWRVGQATVAHVCVRTPDGETAHADDPEQQVVLTFRAESDEVEAFSHLGHPYVCRWGGNMVGLVLDDATDWEEVAELLTDSYCLQAPRGLAARVVRPGRPGEGPPGQPLG